MSVLLRPNSNPVALSRGPALIALGLVLLVASMMWPSAPFVTAFALVIYGATIVMVERFRVWAGAASALILHAVVYGVLYTLAVGAALHTGPQASLGIGSWALADILASFVPVAAAARLTSSVLFATDSSV